MADPADLDLPDNWGRWESDDDVRAQATVEVRTGRWVSPPRVALGRMAMPPIDAQQRC